mgnify:CR=1 FL=1|tara:strand:- start:1088 stop:1399 length:312 start_codon:yes stop_codon:yes gene_type:complete
MAWEEVLKMPPIRNPRESEFDSMPNDNLSMDEYEKLFEDMVDPVIEEAAKRLSPIAYVSVKKLGMSPKKAEMIAQELYDGMGYGRIYVDSQDDLMFKLKTRRD